MDIYEYLMMCLNNNLEGEQWAKREHKLLNDIRNTMHKKKREYQKRNWNYEEEPKEILELKNIVTALKNSLGIISFINSKLDKQKNQRTRKQTRNLKLSSQRSIMNIM